MESGEIYQDNINTSESLSNFLRAQEDVCKKFLNLDINLSGDLEYYIREILDGVSRWQIRRSHKQYIKIFILLF